MRIVECVPNFSEGRDNVKIASIVSSISGIAGAEILHVDSGEAANRTVITFKGSPEAVAEAAFKAVKTASEVIDMRFQHGEHPRIGATDVLPIVPVSDITLEECAEMARNLARKIYSELGIPCYCYEAAAFKPERKRLEVCRRGEYEALAAKIQDPEQRPDFSPATFTDIAARAGATVVGARNFLIAVNFNLNTGSADIATEIAREVRESGKVVTGADGRRTRIPGVLKGCKAIGWYIEEYGIAQVSMNITDISAAPLHKAFMEVSKAAEAHGVKVTGTEIIGLVPRQCLVDAGRFFLGRQNAHHDTASCAGGNKSAASGTPDITETELLDIAVRHLHLDDLRPFDLSSRLI